MVKISVVVPVYNVSEYLDDALSGLLNQTFTDFEVICVNDGSTDNSLDILKKYSKIDSRIKIINKENGGCGSARNRALDEAKGEYVYFFDPDDYILPNAFEELYLNISKNESDLVIFKIAWFMEGEDVNYKKPLFNFDEIFEGVDFNNFTFNYKDIKSYVLNVGFAPWSKMYKKEFLDRYDDFRFDLGVAFDDVPFHVKSILRANKISFAPDFYYHYRYANPNSVNNTSSNGVDIFKIVDIVENFLKSEGYFDELEMEFYEFKITQASLYMISSHSEEYFQIAHETLLEIDEDKVKQLPKKIIKKYDLITQVNSLTEYELNLKLNKLQKEKKRLKKQNDDLRKENKKLKKMNDKILSSNSWKITNPLRKLRNQ